MVDIKNKIVKDIRKQGYCKLDGIINYFDIELLEKNHINKILDMYDEEAVKDRIFYQREESSNRQGDAFMISINQFNKELPSIQIDKDMYLGKIANLYQSVLEDLTGKEVAKDSRIMVNTQTYLKDSLEVYDHYDGEFFDFSHSKDQKHDEDVFKLKSGLIPRYVMVLVLENENNGAGTYIREHNSDVRIEIENNPGDLIIFDNLKFRHGVAKLKNYRRMIGFRNFDHYPYYFESDPEEENNWIELPDNKNPGWIREINNDKAKALMIKFNKRWKEELYSLAMKQKPAF